MHTGPEDSQILGDGTWAAEKQDVFARVTAKCRASVNVPNVRTLLEWELVIRNANKPVVVELQKLRGSAQNRGTPDTEVNIFSLDCLCLVPSFRENGLVLRQLQR